MLPEILYAGLIGALVSLSFSAIFGIFKLIVFVAEKIKNNKFEWEVWRFKLYEFKEKVGTRVKNMNKRKIIIASCVFLGIAILASTVTFISSKDIGKSEHTITFYNNTGIYFDTNSKGEERMYTKFQDITIYKVEKFRGGYPSEPKPPKNEGYVFLGWYRNPECTEKFSFGNYEINSDINLYAKWGKK